ncbi:N-formylglutamate amidohydrolase [Terrihabitans sp. B22-R8]|uniref:N-formylglutamate amidohydrolase n=1 Tax=Terrihabitans sp. B22-R8 TaxID=3425128 RepID=UPI00403D09AB
MAERGARHYARRMQPALSLDAYRGPVDIRPGAAPDVLLLCDHASHAVPDEFGRLGLPEAEFHRHIGYDIGAAELTRRLAERLDATAMFCGFSRLLIDPNRGADDPTLVMRLSDGAVVPGNARIDDAGIADRVARFHQPYHDAIAAWIDGAQAAGAVPVIVSMHSFTPYWKAVPRPWHAAILWDQDPRLAQPLIAGLREDAELIVGDNEPYDGALKNDTCYRHATLRGLANVLIEVRQDLISEPVGQDAWAERLAGVLTPLLAQPHLHVVEHWGSRADRPGRGG